MNSIIYKGEKLLKKVKDFWYNNLRPRYSAQEHFLWVKNKKEGKKDNSKYGIKRLALIKNLVPCKDIQWNNESINLIIEQFIKNE